MALSSLSNFTTTFTEAAQRFCEVAPTVVGHEYNKDFESLMMRAGTVGALATGAIGSFYAASISHSAGKKFAGYAVAAGFFAMFALKLYGTSCDAYESTDETCNYLFQDSRFPGFYFNQQPRDAFDLLRCSLFLGKHWREEL